ncbi:hypothetical protein DXG01_001458, partial [Tephrocybe rancida]
SARPTLAHQRASSESYCGNQLHAAARRKAKGEESEYESDNDEQYLNLKAAIALLLPVSKLHKQEPKEQVAGELEADGGSPQVETEGPQVEGSPSERTESRKRKLSSSITNHELFSKSDAPLVDELAQAQIRRLRMSCSTLVKQRDAAIKERDAAHAKIKKFRTLAVSAATALIILATS